MPSVLPEPIRLQAVPPKRAKKCLTESAAYGKRRRIETGRVTAYYFVVDADNNY
jgi:hypothetical protein